MAKQAELSMAVSLLHTLLQGELGQKEELE
jgi:hypothetical protein